MGVPVVAACLTAQALGPVLDPIHWEDLFGSLGGGARRLLFRRRACCAFPALLRLQLGALFLLRRERTANPNLTPLPQAIRACGAPRHWRGLKPPTEPMVVSLSGAWSQACSRPGSSQLHQGPRMQPLKGPLARPLRAPRLRAAVAAEDQGVEDASSYYSLLGLSPAATPAEIKTAYRSLMRDFHPDKSTDEGNPLLSPPLSSFSPPPPDGLAGLPACRRSRLRRLPERYIRGKEEGEERGGGEDAFFVWEGRPPSFQNPTPLPACLQTLLDPDRRAAYDLIAGFECACLQSVCLAALAAPVGADDSTRAGPGVSAVQCGWHQPLHGPHRAVARGDGLCGRGALRGPGLRAL